MNAKEFAADLFRQVKHFWRAKEALLIERIDASRKAIEGRLDSLPAPEPGPPGKDADIGAILAEVERAVAEAEGRIRSSYTETMAKAIDDAILALPRPKDGEPGKDADPVILHMAVEGAVGAARRELEKDLSLSLGAQLATALDQAVAAIPEPKNGEDGKPADMEAVSREISECVAKAEGRLADSLSVAFGVVIAEGLAKAAATLPAPQKGEPGKDADMDALTAFIEKRLAEGFAAVPTAKDGVSVTAALVNREGNLVLTLSTGATVDVGRVVGKDAEPAKPGESGLGFDDLSVQYDGERTITLAFQRGDLIKSFPIVIPIVLDRGAFDEKKSYEKGDGVTWAGHFWIAQEKTSETPGDGKPQWRLAVRKGRDFRPAERR